MITGSEEKTVIRRRAYVGGTKQTYHDGLTLAEIRVFLDNCKGIGIPDTATPRYTEALSASRLSSLEIVHETEVR